VSIIITDKLINLSELLPAPKESGYVFCVRLSDCLTARTDFYETLGGVARPSNNRLEIPEYTCIMHIL